VRFGHVHAAHYGSDRTIEVKWYSVKPWCSTTLTCLCTEIHCCTVFHFIATNCSVQTVALQVYWGL